MSKARNNDGSIFKFIRKDGTTGYRVEVSMGYDAKGKRRRTRRTVDTLIAAKKLRVQLLKAQQEGRLTEVRSETVLTYSLWWAREVKGLDIRPTTASDYEDRLRRYVIPYLGSVRMVDLTSGHIVKWMNDLKRDGKSSNTINGARRVLTGMCKYAARSGVISFNPVAATDTVKRQAGEPSRVRHPWTQEEMVKVLRVAENYPDLDCFLHLMMHTGMRPGEVFGLRWQDIDEVLESLSVTGTLKQARMITPTGVAVVRLMRNDPKTSSSRRSISISSDLHDALERQKMCQSVARMTAGERWEETDYVITTSIGTPVASTNLRRNFEKFLKTNGVRYIRLHDIRHSVIVLALQLGIPIEQVSQVAGHTRIETTKGIYAPYVPRYTTNFATVVSSVFPSARRRAESETDEWNLLKDRGDSNL